MLRAWLVVRLVVVAVRIPKLPTTHSQYLAQPQLQFALAQEEQRWVLRPPMPSLLETLAEIAGSAVHPLVHPRLEQRVAAARQAIAHQHSLVALAARRQVESGQQSIVGEKEGMQRALGVALAGEAPQEKQRMVPPELIGLLTMATRQVAPGDRQVAELPAQQGAVLLGMELVGTPRMDQAAGEGGATEMETPEREEIMVGRVVGLQPVVRMSLPKANRVWWSSPTNLASRPSASTSQ